VSALHHVGVHGDRLRIGAAVRLTTAFAALLQHYPRLRELTDRFASPPIRNAGTLCGNIANGSPIGDAMPILIALGATVTLRHRASTRTLALEDLYLGYQKKDLEPGEFISAVDIPLPHPDQLVASYKIAKRRDQDISAVCAGFALEVRAGQITAARLAYGGMAATPRRARHAEAALSNQPFTAATIAAAAAALALDFQPLDDLRATAAYRLMVAGNLLQRFFLEQSGVSIAMRVEQVGPA